MKDYWDNAVFILLMQEIEYIFDRDFTNHLTKFPDTEYNINAGVLKHFLKKKLPSITNQLIARGEYTQSPLRGERLIAHLVNVIKYINYQRGEITIYETFC